MPSTVSPQESPVTYKVNKRRLIFTDPLAVESKTEQAQGFSQETLLWSPEKAWIWGKDPSQLLPYVTLANLTY